MITLWPRKSLPAMRPRLLLRSPIRSPEYWSGAYTSTCITGSSNTGRACFMASLKASEPAILKAMSEESTSWYLPSYRMARKSTTGKPARYPRAAASRIPLSTEGIQFLGIAPPKTSSTNSMPLPRSMGSILIRQTPNWPCPPDCFAVRNFGRLQRQIHVVAFVQLGHHHFNVLLAGARKEKFLRLRIAHETQRGIFLHDLVNGHADFVFIGARFGLHRKGDGRFRDLRGFVIDGRGFVAQRIAGRGLFQFGNRADVPCMQFCNFAEQLALHDLRVLKTFRRVAVEIHERGVVLENPALYFEIVDAPRERIGERLEHE